MTDYELAYLFLETLRFLGDSIVNFAGVIFAFLVAGVLAGPKLSRVLTSIAVGIFSIFQLIQIFQIRRAVDGFVGLGFEIRERAQIPGSHLQWHGSLKAPEISLLAMPYIVTPLLFVCYFSALYFFFLCRKGEFSLELK